MGILEFISSILSALAWPIAVIFIVIILRRPLRHLLLRLETLRGPGVEATFERQIEEAKDEVASAVAGSPQVQRSEESRQERLEVDDLLQLADVSPRAAILEAWLRVESALAEAAAKLDLPPNMRRGTLLFIETLERQGVMSPEVGRAIRRLRNLRNVVVHTPTLDISRESIIDYVETAEFIVRSLRSRSTEPG
jgi:hypothetical protein